MEAAHDNTFWATETRGGKLHYYSMGVAFCGTPRKTAADLKPAKHTGDGDNDQCVRCIRKLNG